MLVINSIGNCLEFDFTNLTDEQNKNDYLKTCPHKKELRVLLPKDDSLGVRLIVNNDERYYVPYELVESVNGITPTSNAHLYELLRNAYSS